MKKRTLQVICALAMGITTMNSAIAAHLEHYTHPKNRSKNLPFSEGVLFGKTLYLAGQIGIPPGESKVVSGGMKAEARQTLKNIEYVLKHFELDFNDVVKCLVMLEDIKDWPEFNEVYKEFFSAPYPARSAFAGSGLALGAKVEVECIANASQKAHY